MVMESRVPTNIPDISQPHKKNILGWLILALFLVIFGVSVFLFIIKMMEEKDLFADLSGRVYLTLAPEGTREADLYYFDLETRSMNKVIEDGFTKYTSRFSPSGDTIAYMAAVLDKKAPLRPERKGRESFPFRGTLQLYVRDMNTGDVKQLTNDVVSEEHLAGKRLPRWSPDGKQIAFSAQRLKAKQYNLVSPLEPNSWDVFIADLDGNIEHAYSGLYSFWSPDGDKLLYLRNDGLYVYNIEDKDSAKVHPVVGGEASAGMKLDVSGNGTYLAWGHSASRPIKGLRLYFIVSWEPFFLQQIKRIDTNNTLVMWPVFSPDNHYFVTQEVELLNEEPRELSNLRLMVYDLETFSNTKLSSLEEYNFDVSYITDWR